MSLNVEHLPQALGLEAAVAWDNILERAGDELSRLLADAASDAAVSAEDPAVDDEAGADARGDLDER